MTALYENMISNLLPKPDEDQELRQWLLTEHVNADFDQVVLMIEAYRKGREDEWRWQNITNNDGE